MRCSIYRIVRDGRYYIKNSEISQKIPMFFRYFKDGHVKKTHIHLDFIPLCTYYIMPL